MLDSVEESSVYYLNIIPFSFSFFLLFLTAICAADPLNLTSFPTIQSSCLHGNMHTRSHTQSFLHVSSRLEYCGDLIWEMVSTGFDRCSVNRGRKFRFISEPVLTLGMMIASYRSFRRRQDVSIISQFHIAVHFSDQI